MKAPTPPRCREADIEGARCIWPAGHAWHHENDQHAKWSRTGPVLPHAPMADREVVTIPHDRDSLTPMARPKNLRGGRKPRTATPATEKITVRLTVEERERIENEASVHATTPGALMRDRGLERRKRKGGAS